MQINIFRIEDEIKTRFFNYIMARDTYNRNTGGKGGHITRLNGQFDGHILWKDASRLSWNGRLCLTSFAPWGALFYTAMSLTHCSNSWNESEEVIP